MADRVSENRPDTGHARDPGIHVATLALALRGNASDSTHVLRGTRGATRDHMLRVATLGLFVLTSACFSDSAPHDGDIVGPYTGPRTRYVVDGFRLPTTNNEARMFGSDIDGNSGVDNRLGQVISTLIQWDVTETNIDDRIRGGELELVVEIQADDLQNDDRVGVWIYGGGDTNVRPVGGSLVDGVFIPNWIRDTDPENTGSATLPLPIIADADTSLVAAPYVQLSLVPDGNGGYDAQIHAGVRGAMQAASAAVVQQLRERPSAHRWMWAFVDREHDGVVEAADVEQNILFESLLHWDVKLFGEELLSVGIGFHLVPCATGNCALSSSVEHCFDRVRDADEVDVDCGGSCGPCGVGLHCERGEDCQSGACEGNVCTAPTCFDGIKNGFEPSVDCGGACAQNCAIGQVCGMDLDCDYGCTVGISPGSGPGVCKGPLG